MKKLRLLAIFVLMAIFQNCNLDKTTEDFDLRLKPELMAHSAQLNISDASDPAVIPENITLSIEGENATDVYEVSGVQQFEVVNGKIGIGLHPRGNPTPEDPATITIFITADGYLDKRTQISLSVDEESQLVEIPMVKVDNPPTGVSFEINNTALVGDSLSNDYAIDLPPANGSSTGMDMVVPKGTEFLDADGNKIRGGQLDVQVGHFDNQQESALSSFPGGFSPDSLIDENGNGTSGTFVTGGFATIDMSVNGTDVKNFSKPVTVTMEVNANTINPNTGTTVAVGDSFPIWSFDQAANTWQYETDGIVRQGTNGLEVAYQITHLSWYNLDFKGRRCCGGNWTRVGRRWRYQWLGNCKVINISMPGFERSDYEYFKIRTVYAGTNQSVSRWSTKYKHLYDGARLTVRNAPSANVEVLVYDRSNNIIGRSGTTTLCNGSMTMNVNATPPQRIVFDVEGVCANNQQVSIKPSFWVYYKPTAGSSYFRTLGYLNQGQGSTTLLNIGDEYEFCAYYAGTRVCTTGVVDKQLYNVTLTLPESFCNSL